jgi:hypothetical protein
MHRGSGTSQSSWSGLYQDCIGDRQVGHRVELSTLGLRLADLEHFA